VNANAQANEPNIDNGLNVYNLANAVVLKSTLVVE
jgi:hypothetical protein